MKKAICGMVLGLLLLGAGISGKAFADGDWENDSYTPPSYTYEAPSYTYDYESGNSYVYTPYSWGGGSLQGWNTNDGSQWNTTYYPNGDMSGWDSDGNSWQYNENTGNYWNSDGTFCSGSGEYRACW